MNPYAVLGVARDAPIDEIKKVYRRLARETHPDLNPGDAKAEARFKEATEAYEVLRDPQKRAAYDRYGKAGLGRGGGGFEYHHVDLTEALNIFMRDFGGLGGFEGNFLPEDKALHDAGYNILAYDIRNHGMSGQGNGGIVGIGLLEYRDVIGSLRYAKSRPDTKNMKKALLSVCLGADSTAVAWSKHPEEFDEIRAMVMLQPVSANYIVDEFVKAVGIEDGYAKFDQAVHERTGFHLAEQSPLEHVKAVTVPTLVAQVRTDPDPRPALAP